MGKIFYILLMLVLLTSCKKEEKTQIQQQNIPISKIDSVTTTDFGECKSIHQQEWEEHQEDLVDTLKIQNNQ